jgi:Kef-type K+ transport system membrane component KefB
MDCFNVSDKVCHLFQNSHNVQNLFGLITAIVIFVVYCGSFGANTTVKVMNMDLWHAAGAILVTMAAYAAGNYLGHMVFKWCAENKLATGVN